jgi:hypothetical protein
LPNPLISHIFKITNHQSLFSGNINLYSNRYLIGNDPSIIDLHYRFAHHCQGAPPVSTLPVANLPPVSWTSAVNFATGTAGVVANLPPVSTISEENLLLVSMTPEANCHQCQWHRGQISTGINNIQAINNATGGK